MNFSSWALAPEALGAGWDTPGVPFTDVEAGASPGAQEVLPEESFWAPLLAPSWSPPGVLPASSPSVLLASSRSPPGVLRASSWRPLGILFAWRLPAWRPPV
jgi:hypothetical protein